MDISELKVELEKLHGSSFGWALSCCLRDHSEAEEVLQIVYLKILEGRARYLCESSLKTWLFAVIRKTAQSERRKSGLRALKSIAMPNQTLVESNAAPEPEAALERSEAQKRFLSALANLPARQREALHLVFYEDLSLREAADVMGVSIGSARQHYERGKKRLRAALEREEIDYGANRRRNESSSAVS